jgi:ankyrin repeat protein
MHLRYRRIVGAVISIVAICIFASSCEHPSASMIVTQKDYGKRWPFREYSQGRIFCRAKRMATIQLGGREYGLNGTAKDGGYPDPAGLLIIPDGPSVYRETLVEFLEIGLALCDGKNWQAPSITKAPVDKPSGYTGIHDAALRGDIAAVKGFLKKGIAADATTAKVDAIFPESEVTPLHLAQSIEIAQLLLESGAKIDSQNSNGETPLYLATQRGDAKLSEFLLSAGANPNAKTKSGATPVLAALTNDKMVANRSIETIENTMVIVRALLRKGANVNAQDNFGNFTMYEAEIYLPVEDLQYLIDHGADIDSIDPDDGYTVLHSAVADERVDVVKVLLDHGANQNVHDNEGETPVDIARRNHRDMPNNKKLSSIVEMFDDAAN